MLLFVPMAEGLQSKSCSIGLGIVRYPPLPSVTAYTLFFKTPIAGAGGQIRRVRKAEMQVRTMPWLLQQVMSKQNRPLSSGCVRDRVDRRGGGHPTPLPGTQ